MNKKNKRAQEEMVGFAIIIVIVFIILLFFLNFYIKSEKKQSVESYEADSFIQAALQYTTECRDYFEYLSVQKLIFECANGALCLDGQEACGVLDSTLRDIVEKSWPIGEDRPVKGYKLEIKTNHEELFSFEEGNATGNYKGAKQDLTKQGVSIEIFFRVYYLFFNFF